MIPLSEVALAKTEASNEFIKPKRAKKKSAARLKDEIGTELTQSLLKTTEIIEQVGKLQRELMQMTAALIEQPADSSLTKADRNGLTGRVQSLNTMHQEIKAIEKRVQHHTTIVKKQY